MKELKLSDFLAMVGLLLFIIIASQFSKGFYNEPCYQRSSIEMPKCR